MIKKSIYRKLFGQLHIVVIMVGLIALSSPAFGYYSNSNFRILSIVKQQLKTEYVEKELEDKKLEYGAIKGMLKSLDDPYTRFIEPKSFKEMQVRLSGEFFGVGIQIGMRKNKLTVISPINGTPAYKAGIKPLDQIVSIDGDLTEGKSLTEAVSKIRGEKGTPVILGILRKPEKNPFDVKIVRGKIKLKAVEKVEVFNDKIGYIQLTTFESKRAIPEFIEGLQKLKKQNIEALILDLRFNGGGLLSNAVDLASILMKSGDIVHTINRYGTKSTHAVSGRPLFAEKPLVVLLNEGSASASEIVAGAIKDNGRGKIVGKNSFGKASVQKILNLPDKSAVLFTIAKYYTPKMTDITKKGITVDIEYKVPTSNLEIYKDPDFVYTFETDWQLQESIKLAKKQLEDIKTAKK